jgi:multidrug efflux pump subunit AcrA (membrane-fusion protein)
MRVKLLLILLLASTALAVAGCSVFGGSTPQPLPTVVLDTPRATAQGAPAAVSGSGVTASGVVAPARQVTLAAAAAGSIQTLGAAVGDSVQGGQVLVSLSGSEKLAAALEAANLELLAAQQAVKALQDGAAQALADAQLRLANAQKALDDAKQRRTWMDYRIGSDSDIQSAQAAVVLALDRLKKAQDAYGPLENKDSNDVNRAAALDALAAAQKLYDQKVANFNALLNRPNPVDVNLAQAVLVAAQAEATTAQQQVDSLKNGPDPDAAALAAERLKNAQAQVAALQSSMADLELKAPFAGTVTRVNVDTGEWVAPGQPLLELADLSALHVETTDLSERDVPRLAPGQAATVQVKALNQNVAGHITAIAPLADTLGGDVVYKVTIELDAPPAALRAGMSVTVQFQ